MKKGNNMINEKIGDSIDILKIKVKTFFDEGVDIHISYKFTSNKGWVNGAILEIKENYFVLDEHKNGNKDIFFEEIRNIERYTTNKEREKGKKEGNKG